MPDEDVRRMREAGFRAYTDDACLARARTVVICVPTSWRQFAITT
ncbi:hypothetical protein [Streptomyces sp. DG1A-41]